MLDKSYYFSERSYLNDSQVINNDILEYWKSLLGEEVCSTLIANHGSFSCYLKNDKYTVKENNVNTDLFRYITKDIYLDKIESQFIETSTFSQFYKPLIGYALEQLQEALAVLKDWYDDSIYSNFEKSCLYQLQKICVRSLIAKLHEYKQHERLQGSSSSEEYVYFNAHIVGTKEFFIEVFEEFPVLYRMVVDSLNRIVDFYVEVIRYYQDDFVVIQNKLGLHEAERKIVTICSGIADGHNNGRQVLKIQLDKGTTLLYKPHSMNNEKCYEVLLNWLEDKTGISQMYYPFLSYSDHGWSSLVVSRTCNAPLELAKYYQRFGLHLFLSWILGTKDLHFENLIAAGEYPVIVDLEALLSHGGHHSRIITVDEEILYQLSQTVLMSGLLPYYHWNKEGEGIDGSAISGAAGQVYPFKIPGITNDKTSDMRVEYYQPRTSMANNLATLNGAFESPGKYEQEIIKGFLAGYRAVMNDKMAFLRVARVLKDGINRYLVSDTQRYSMLINSSYHPSLLIDAVEREIFLHAIWQGRDDWEKPIVTAEVDRMVNGDIPLFYCKADETALYDGDNIVCENYFDKTAYDEFVSRVKLLNSVLIQKQCDCISLSLRMMRDGTNKYFNKTYFVDSETNKETQVFTSVKEKCDTLIKRILDYAIWNKERTQVSWFTVYMSERVDVSWFLTPMNMYLYDGLAGMFLILAKAQQMGYGNKVSEYVDTLRNMFFTYTDKGLIDTNCLHTTLTGAYEGEASILHMYLNLYYMTKDSVYLEYAKKHACIVENLLEQDEKYDLLSGNAGAAYVLLQLYQVTKDKKHMQAAEHAVSILEKSAVAKEKGIGWSVDTSTPAMSGMAHGNSGFLMPVIWLWNLTKSEKYRIMAEEIWQYENSLYNPRTKNWDDLHVEQEVDDTIGAVAWCHGAPGIMLSRILCYELVEDRDWKSRFAKEILIGYEKLKQSWKRDSWSLCHGNCGNLWILAYAEDFLRNKKWISIEAEFVAEMTKERCLSKEIEYMPQEILNPGLFNGYGGIALYLLQT